MIFLQSLATNVTKQHMDANTVSRPLNLLFLCTGNSCRSQMAEGWARTLLHGQCIAYSAGVVAHGLNPNAVSVMAEVGIDISQQLSRSIDELPKVAFDVVVTVCDNARESCPIYPGARVQIHHSFDDPPRLAAESSHDEGLEIYRRVRDEIRDMVVGLQVYLETARQASPQNV